MLGDIFLARYQVESSLVRTPLFEAFEVKDLLEGDRGFLFLYPYQDRPPLDPLAFSYRQQLFGEVLGGRVADCQMGEEGRSLYLLTLGKRATESLAAIPMGARRMGLLAEVTADVRRCRTAGLHLLNLNPRYIRVDDEDGLLYLPPVYLQHPGFTVPGAGEKVAPELRWGVEYSPAADLHELGRLFAGLGDGAAPAGFGGLAEADPFARAAGEGRAKAPWLGEPLPELWEAKLLAAVDAARGGSNVILCFRGSGPEDSLSTWRISLQLWFSAHAGEGLSAGCPEWGGLGLDLQRTTPITFCEDFRSPSLLLDPVWSRQAEAEDEERHFLLIDSGSLDRAPGLESWAWDLLHDLPRLHQAELEIPARVPAVDAAARLEAVGAADRPLLEVLGLQCEPLSLSLLSQFFPAREDVFFAQLRRLELGGEIILRPGLDQANGLWGLRAEIADHAWREWLGERIGAERRRALHRLCANLLEAKGKRSPGRAYRSLLHRIGAEDWAGSAAKGFELFHQSMEQGQHLMVERLAMLLQNPAIEAELSDSGKRDIYAHLGQHQVDLGNLDEAKQIYRRGLTSLTGNGEFLEEILKSPQVKPRFPEKPSANLLPAVSELLRRLADIHETRGEFALAIDYLSRLLDAFSEIFSAPERGIVYNDLAWLLHKKGQHETAIEHCEVALRLFDPQKHSLELGQTYNTLGAAQWALNHWPEAETYYKRALALREKAGDENRVAASLNNLGNLSRHTEQFPQALDYFNRSMAIKKRRKNHAGYMISLYNVALINFEMRDLRTARNKSLECLDLNRLVGNVQLNAEVKGLLGEIAQVEGHYEDACRYLDESIEICREIEAHTELATMLRRMIPIRLALRDFDGAQIAITEGLQEVWRVGNRLEEARIRVFEAELEQARGDGDAALKAYGQAADLYSALDRYEVLARTYSAMGLVHLKQGEEIRARECLAQATEIIERRKVSALISEWNELQMQLQQRLGHYVQRISGAGKTRLASLYQLLGLLGGKGEAPDTMVQALGLLANSFDYQRVALCLFSALPGKRAEGSFLLGAGEFPDEAEWLAEAESLRESARLSTIEREGAGQPSLRIFVPLRLGGDNLGFLALERKPGDCDEDEQDFLGGIASLLSLSVSGRGSSPLPVSAAPERREEGEKRGEVRLIGQGRDMQRLRRLIGQVKDVDATILITGESGTGKEEVARAIHFESKRSEQPFLAVNCAAIPPALLESSLFGHERGSFTGATHRHIGVFEEAGTGTVFLDEIGEMGPDMQAKLLRVLQSKEFTRVGGTRSFQCHGRVLTATNRELLEEVKNGRFREDLYYRVNVVNIPLIALRQKREDIPLLVEFFLHRACAELGIPTKRIAPEIMELFLRHSWPGNVRQLQNVINACVILSRDRLLKVEDLPEDFHEVLAPPPPSKSLEELADLVIGSGLFSENKPLEENFLATLSQRLVEGLGSKAKAARMLGISKPTLYRRLRIYDKLRP